MWKRFQRKIRSLKQLAYILTSINAGGEGVDFGEEAYFASNKLKAKKKFSAGRQPKRRILEIKEGWYLVSQQFFKRKVKTDLYLVRSLSSKHMTVDVIFSTWVGFGPHSIQFYGSLLKKITEYEPNTVNRIQLLTQWNYGSGSSVISIYQNSMEF